MDPIKDQAFCFIVILILDGVYFMLANICFCIWNIERTIHAQFNLYAINFYSVNVEIGEQSTIVALCDKEVYMSNISFIFSFCKSFFFIKE